LYYPDDKLSQARKPKHKGKRLCFIAGILDDGPDGSKLLATRVFRGGSRQTKDYHGMFNHAYFVNWMKELMDELDVLGKSGAVIVMDNASYHKGPIEYVWAYLKGGVGRQYTTATTMEDVRQRLDLDFSELPSDLIYRCTSHTKKKVVDLSTGSFAASSVAFSSSSAAIVKNPEFEDGVVNALLGSEASLTSVEADAIKALRDSQASQGSEEGFAVLVLSLAERSVS
ncbi:hypothetical protein B5M09_012889, partial [Aphanomyces astaci]